MQSTPPLRFGFLMPVPRTENEAMQQIPAALELIQQYHPDVIGIVSPTDVDLERTRTAMWKKFVDAIKSINSESRIMQHLPYTSVGNVGIVSESRSPVTQQMLDRRLQELKDNGIQNVLALKGWEGTSNYLEEGELSAKQDLLFRSTPDWVGHVRNKFDGFVAATTYIEGHCFRRIQVPSDYNEATGGGALQEWVAVQTEDAESIKRGIPLEHLKAGIRYDIEKIRNGATTLFCNMVFDSELFLNYRRLFQDVLGEEARKHPTLAVLNDNYQLYPEIALGSSKKAFIDKVLFGSVYCSSTLRQNILDAGACRLSQPHMLANVIKQDKKTQQLRTRTAEIIKVNNAAEVSRTSYTVKYMDNHEVEDGVPLQAISDDEIDKEVEEIWLNYMVEQVKVFKENGVQFIYIMSLNPAATQVFMNKCDGLFGASCNWRHSSEEREEHHK